MTVSHLFHSFGWTKTIKLQKNLWVCFLLVFAMQPDALYFLSMWSLCNAWKGKKIFLARWNFLVNSTQMFIEGLWSFQMLSSNSKWQVKVQTKTQILPTKMLQLFKCFWWQMTFFHLTSTIQKLQLETHEKKACQFLLFFAHEEDFAVVQMFLAANDFFSSRFSNSKTPASIQWKRISF